MNPRRGRLLDQESEQDVYLVRVKQVPVGDIPGVMVFKVREAIGPYAVVVADERRVHLLIARSSGTGGLVPKEFGLISERFCAGHTLLGIVLRANSGTYVGLCWSAPRVRYEVEIKTEPQLDAQ